KASIGGVTNAEPITTATATLINKGLGTSRTKTARYVLGLVADTLRVRRRDRRLHTAHPEVYSAFVQRFLEPFNLDFARWSIAREGYRTPDRFVAANNRP